MRMKTTKEAKETKKDIVKDSIIKDYLKYVEYLENSNYIRERITIYENLSSIVTINNLKMSDEGTVIDVVCPPGRIISVMGTKSIITNIENIRPFEIRLGNSNGDEIDPEVRIKILRNKILRNSVEICDIPYKDINMVNYTESPNKFKNYAELYRFEYGIELKGEDHLKIFVINPNIDINDVKFNLGVDFWTPV